MHTPTSKYNLSKCVNELLKSDHKEIKWNDFSFISKTVAAFYIWRSRCICACEWDSQMVDRVYKRTTKCKSSILIKMKTVGNFYFMIYSNYIYLCLTAEAMLVNEQTGGRTYTHTSARAYKLVELLTLSPDSGALETCSCSPLHNEISKCAQTKLNKVRECARTKAIIHWNNLSNNEREIMRNCIIKTIFLRFNWK